MLRPIKSGESDAILFVRQRRPPCDAASTGNPCRLARLTLHRSLPILPFSTAAGFAVSELLFSVGATIISFSFPTPCPRLSIRSRSLHHHEDHNPVELLFIHRSGDGGTDRDVHAKYLPHAAAFRLSIEDDEDAESDFGHTSLSSNISLRCAMVTSFSDPATAALSRKLLSKMGKPGRF